VKLEIRPYLALTFIIILADQLTKIYINAKYTVGHSERILGEFLSFTFVYNSGGAFGLNFGSFWFYTFLSIIAIVVILVYFLKTPDKQKIAKLCLALVTGGAVGNLLDRIIHGQVTDFIDVNIPDIIIRPFTLFSFDFPGFELYRWYIFNIADAAITVGLIGFIIYLMFQDKFDPDILSDNQTTP
jgi:signal peptidase II